MIRKGFKTIAIFNKDYVISLWIFRVISIICLLAVLAIWYQDSFSGNNHFSSYCEPQYKEGCYNIFYNNIAYCGKEIDANNSLCTIEHMSPGQFLGEAKPWYLLYLWQGVIAIYLIGLLVNSLIWGFRNQEANIEVKPSQNNQDKNKPLGGELG